MSVIDDLRSLSAGDAVRAETDEGDEYTFHVVGEVDYVEPDVYGAGHLEVSIEFDTDVHEVPSDALPEDTGTVIARAEDSDSLGRPKLSVRAPDFEEHTGAWVEDWDVLGRVVSVEVLDIE